MASVLLLYFVLFLFCYLFGVKLSPLPHWPTYFLLWKNVLFNRTSLVPLSARVHQVLLLLQYAFKAPLYGYLWKLDDILFSQYLTKEIKPVFITGEPRSGTTFLHRTLAADEDNFFAIRHIEWRYPFISIPKLISWFNIDKYIRDISYWPSTPIGEQAKKMHSNNLLDYEEDGIFYEECFLFHFFTILRFPYEALLDYLDAFENLSHNDQQLIIQTHRKVIQKIMFLRGSNKVYLSKEVTSHTKLRIMLETYATAKFIVHLRHSNEFMSSLLRLMQVSTQCKTGIDIYSPNSTFKSRLIRRMQEDCSILVDFIQGHASYHSSKRSSMICIPYLQLIREPFVSITHIYQRLNLTLSSAFLDQIQWIQRRQWQRERGYSYDQEDMEGFDHFNALVLRYSCSEELSTPLMMEKPFGHAKRFRKTHAI